MSRRLVDEDDLSDQRLYTDEEIHVFYGQLVERLKAEGVYREDEDESKEKTHAGKNRYNKVVQQHRRVKTAGFAIVCFLGVLAVSMISETNRNYVVKTITYLFSDETNVIVDNVPENEYPA
ncbi:MAG: hypothetical protein UDM02_08335 [Blautia sp.]|nr:hypothetical protein [Blautia sp.]